MAGPTTNTRATFRVSRALGGAVEADKGGARCGEETRTS